MEGLLSSGKLQVEPVLTGHTILNDFESVFAEARLGPAGKLIFDLANFVTPVRLHRAGVKELSQIVARNAWALRI